MNKAIRFFFVDAVMMSEARSEESTVHPVSANLALTTNYKFRGQDQGDFAANTFRPAVQGGSDWTKDGFYLGNVNTSIGWLAGASVEMDFYGGYKGEIGTTSSVSPMT